MRRLIRRLVKEVGEEAGKVLVTISQTMFGSAGSVEAMNPKHYLGIQDSISYTFIIAIHHLIILEDGYRAV